MKEIAEKLVKVGKEIIAEKGNLDLLALFMPQGSAGEWDLVLSADWASRDKPSAIKYVAGKVVSYLKPSDLVRISRIVVLDQITAPLSSHIQQSRSESVSVSEVGPFMLNDILVERAFIVVFKKRVIRKVRRSVA